MALPKIDTFVQTSGSSQGIATYDSNWSVLEGALSVPDSADNYVSSGSGYNTARWGGDTFNADHYSQLTWQVTTGYYLGPAVRCQSGANTSYHVDCNDSQYYLSKCLAGSQSTLLGPIDITDLTNGDILRLEVTTVGSDAVLKVFIALAASPTTFVQQDSDYTDSSSPITTAGYAGIFGYDPSSSFGPGPFKADNLGGGGGPTVSGGFRSLLGVGR